MFTPLDRTNHVKEKTDAVRIEFVMIKEPANNLLDDLMDNNGTSYLSGLCHDIHGYIRKLFKLSENNA
jgi:hypothetical protein